MGGRQGGVRRAGQPRVPDSTSQTRCTRRQATRPATPLDAPALPSSRSPPFQRRITKISYKQHSARSVPSLGFPSPASPFPPCNSEPMPSSVANYLNEPSLPHPLPVLEYHIDTPPQDYNLVRAGQPRGARVRRSGRLKETESYHTPTLSSFKPLRTSYGRSASSRARESGWSLSS